MQIELTPDEAQTLVHMMDIAVKQAGLEAAFVAVPIFHKLQAAANAPAQQEQDA